MDTLRMSAPPLAELRAARGIWEWHYRFEKDDAIKTIAAQCEGLYQKHPLVSAFQAFFSFELYDEAKVKIAQIGEKLGVQGTCEEIHQFLDQAQEFAPVTADWHTIISVADCAGAYWKQNTHLVAFAREALLKSPSDIKFLFGARLLNRKLRDLRESGETAVLSQELDWGAAAAPNADSESRLLSVLYGHPHPLITGLLTARDLEFVGGRVTTLTSMEPWVKCQLLGGMYHTDWNRFRELTDEIWLRTPEELRLQTFLALFGSMRFIDLFRKDYPGVALNGAHYDWLLGLMLALPDLDEVNDVSRYHMEELSARFGMKDAQWLLAAIRGRVQTFDSKPMDERGGGKIVPTRHRLTKYVAQMPPAGALAASLKQAISTFLDYTERKDMLGYILPQYASDLDPHGALVPELVESRIQSVKERTKEAIWAWTRFAGYYVFNSQPWKRIAKAAIIAAEGLPPRDKNSIFVTLLSQEIRSSNYPAGEMDPRPEQDLLRRKRELQEETDAAVLPFREWHLAVAQAEYDQALAQYKEENEL